jgi:hypothetical protein
MDGSRYALVVANDQYSDPGMRRLLAPAEDAAALADTLADPSIGGFQVRVLHNESAQSIRLAVEDFFADRDPQDLLLLHFSGHGLKNAGGELFLAVADTRPTRLASTAVAADFVNRQMADSRAQRIALFLDCCYGGAFPRGMVVRAAGEAAVGDAFARQEKVGGGRGRVVVTASSAMEYSFEGGQLAAGAKPTPSVFTSAVVDGLTTGEADRDGDGWVGLTELVGYVTDRVHRVMPNQNPQMWTFGAQGELLIARSRRRRITPTPLPPELLEAMDSPLTATRFGVVDDLRERLQGADLGQAYAAYQALQRMVEDDSRKVCEAAARWVAAAAPQVAPDSLDLGQVVLGEAAGGELRLNGPPLALAATASASTAWIRVEQSGAAIRVAATPTQPGPAEGAVTIKGPTGEQSVPVRLRAAMPEPVPVATAQEREPEPVPEPEPGLVAAAAAGAVPAATPEPVSMAAAATEAVPVAVPEPVSAAATAGAAAPKPAPEAVTAELVSPPVGRTPWWVTAALALGAIILLAVNWPGPEESRLAWSDSGTGWHVYRSFGDPYFLASLLALAGALATLAPGRVARYALAVVAGSGVFLASIGAVYLLGEITGDETGAWLVTVVVAAALAVTALRVAKLDLRRARPTPWPGVALLVAGGGLLFAGSFATHDGNSFLEVSKGASVLALLALLALAWPAVTSDDMATRRLLGVAAGTDAMLAVVDSLPAVANGLNGLFILGLLGNAVLVAGVVMAAQRPAHDADHRPPEPGRGVRWSAWIPAIGLSAVALLLVLLNGAALHEQQKLWYGPAELIRQSYDGTLLAALVAVIAALLTPLGGRLAAYALGVVAGVATLFGTAGVVILGGGLSYYGTSDAWTVSLILAAVLLAGVAVIVARRRPRLALGRPAVLSGALVAAGAVVLLGTQFTVTDGTDAAATVAASLPLLAAVPTVLAALAITLADADTRCTTVGAALAYCLLFAVASGYPIYADTVPNYFVGMLTGHLVLAAAVVADLVLRHRKRSAVPA